MYELRMANGETREFLDEASVFFNTDAGKLTVVVGDQRRVFSDSAWTELIYPETQESGPTFAIY